MKYSHSPDTSLTQRLTDSNETSALLLAFRQSLVESQPPTSEQDDEETQSSQP